MRSGNCYHYNVFFDIGENYFIPIVLNVEFIHEKKLLMLNGLFTFAKT